MNTPNPIEFDRAGFPMIYLDSVKAHLHWLPVTKIQFEYFLFEAGSSGLDQAWLDRLYQLNGRISPRKIGKGNYWRALMTGIAPVEAALYADWCSESDEGSEYRLPKAEQWQKAYEEARDRECLDWTQWSETDHPRIPDRAKTLFRQIRESLPVGEARKLADQMLFDGGVLEWVNAESETKASSEWGAYGQTNRSFVVSGMYLTRLFPVRTVPKSPEDQAGRAPYYGFRLLRFSKT